MSTALANFLFEIANLLVLAAALGWLVFNPIRAALRAERDRLAEESKAASTARAQAEEMREQARQAHETLEQELAAHHADLLAAARKEAADVKEAARKSQRTEERDQEKKREEARHAESERLAETLGRIAASSVRRLLDALDGPSLDQALVRQVCRELSAHEERGLGSCLVESARPLDEESRALLTRALGTSFEEHTVPELGAGLRVTTPSGQVDGSAIMLSRQAAKEVASIAATHEDEGAPS